LPVNFPKIDGDFMSDISNDPVDQAMLQLIIQMAKTLKKQTIRICARYYPKRLW